MTLSPAASIAASGLALESTRLAVSAGNVANLNTPGFSARQVQVQESADGGVTGTITSTGKPTDLVRETVTQITAVVAYKMNLAVIRSADQMTGALLDAYV